MKTINIRFFVLMTISYSLISCSGAKFSLNKVKPDLKETVVVKNSKKVSQNYIEVVSKDEKQDIVNSSTIASIEESVSIPVEPFIEKQNALAGSESLTITPEQTITNYGNTAKGSEGSGTDGLAIAGFVSSLVGIFVAGVILGTLGVVFSIIALTRLSRSGKKGKGLAIAGLVIGIVAVVGAFIVIATM